MVNSMENMLTDVKVNFRYNLKSFSFNETFILSNSISFCPINRKNLVTCGEQTFQNLRIIA